MTSAEARLDLRQAEAAPAFPAWPVFGLVEDVRPFLFAAMDRAEPVALATLWRSEGGSPRGIGAQMAVTVEAMAGYLSGGCIEADVALHARAALTDERPRRLVYGRGGPVDTPLPCGGRIEVLVEALTPDDRALAALAARTARREPILWLSDGRRRACMAPGQPAPLALARADPDALVRKLWTPRPRLILLGSEPIALALAQIAVASGFETVLIRPKGPEEPPPVPGVDYRHGAPQDVLAKIQPDRWTAVAALSHDLDQDHALIAPALASSAFYVGALGSRRRLEERLQRLRLAGLDAPALARLKAPIGLDIGARSAWEIAFAIMADLIQALPQADG